MLSWVHIRRSMGYVKWETLNRNITDVQHDGVVPKRAYLYVNVYTDRPFWRNHFEQIVTFSILRLFCVAESKKLVYKRYTLFLSCKVSYFTCPMFRITLNAALKFNGSWNKEKGDYFPWFSSNNCSLEGKDVLFL